MVYILRRDAKNVAEIKNKIVSAPQHCTDLKIIVYLSNFLRREKKKTFNPH